MKRMKTAAGLILLIVLALAVSCSDEAVKLTLSYDANGGFGTPVPQECASGAELTVSDGASLVYEDHKFTEWNTARDGSGTAFAPGSTIKMTKDVKLYAQWKDAFTVSFLPNGAQGETKKVTAEKGEKITAPDGSGLIMAHYDFDSWNTVADGTGTKYMPGDQITVEKTMNLYARWKNHVYTITFNSNGGTGTVDPVSAFYGNVVVIPAGGFEREGYTFTGWNTKSDGSGTEVESGQHTVTATLELFAQWKQGVPVTQESDIDFKNGGTYWLKNDITLTSEKTAEANIFFDLCDNKLLSEYNLIVDEGVMAEFESGEIGFCTIHVGGSVKTASAAGLSLSGVTAELSGGIGITVCGDESLLLVDESSISCSGTIGVMADHMYAQKATIAFRESSVEMTGTDADSCALLVSAPDSLASFSESALSGKRQGAVIRSGEMMATETSFVCSGEYSGASYKDNPWGDLNSVPSAALVFGDDNSLVTSPYTNTSKSMTGTLSGCIFSGTGNCDSVIWMESNQEESTSLSITAEEFDESQLTVYGGLPLVNGDVPLLGSWSFENEYLELTAEINADFTGEIFIQSTDLSTKNEISDWKYDMHENFNYTMRETSMGEFSFIENVGGDVLTIDSYGLLSGTFLRSHEEGGPAGAWTKALGTSVLTLTLRDESQGLYDVEYDDEYGNDFTGSILFMSGSHTFNFQSSDDAKGHYRIRMEKGKLNVDGIVMTRE